MYIVGKYNIYLYDLLKEEGHECHIYIKAHVMLKAIIVISVVLIHYYKTVFPKVNWSWMDIRSSRRVWITGPSIKFTGHSHTSQSRCSDSYWSFGPVMNDLLLDKTNFYWTLPHVRLTMRMTDKHCTWK